MYAPHLDLPESSLLRKGHLTRNSQQAPHLSHSPDRVPSTGSRRLVQNLVSFPSNGPDFVRLVSILTGPCIPIRVHILFPGVR